MRVRAEAFGAWVRVDDGTLVAVDRPMARALGVPADAHRGDVGTAAPTRPLEAHVAVTARCPVGCTGCYQSAVSDGEEVPLGEVLATLDALADAGVFTVAFGGGEPLTHSDLGAIARAARDRGMIPVVTTSGIGLTPTVLDRLRDFAQVNVSHDGVAGGYAAVRGFDGARTADRAIRALADAGIPVGVNHVLTQQNVGHLADTARHVRSLGARELQVLRYKPAGRAASMAYLSRRLTLAQCKALGPTLRAMSTEHDGGLSVRIDCALVPLVADALPDVESLARFGVFGCEAGRYLSAVRRDGSVAGCSFAPTSGGHVRDFASTWTDEPGLSAFRDFVRAPPEPCAGCPVREVCRGGCKVVTHHLEDTMGPDPECPRVIAWRATFAPNALP